VATPELTPTTGFYSPSTEIAVTGVVGPEGSFYVARKTAFRDRDPVPYTLKLPTSKGVITIPHLGGTLTMPGRDTRIHVTDYPLGDTLLVYSTAEIFTWQKYEDKTIAVLYGAADETHELLIKRNSVFGKASPDVKTKQDGMYMYAQWKPTMAQHQTIQVGDDLYIYLVGQSTVSSKSKQNSQSTNTLRQTVNRPTASG
jgi:hypothetical protein